MCFFPALTPSRKHVCAYTRAADQSGAGIGAVTFDDVQSGLGKRCERARAHIARAEFDRFWQGARAYTCSTQQNKNNSRIATLIHVTLGDKKYVFTLKLLFKVVFCFFL